MDYHPFGLAIAGRSYNKTNYRFGFNGMEKSDDLTTGGYTTLFRQYNPSIGRFLSVDPYSNKYPSQSPYNYSLNSPLSFGDSDGDSVRILVTNKIVGYTKVNLFSASEVNNNTTLTQKTIMVPVFEVIVTSDELPNDQAIFYFTRIAFRGNSNSPTDTPTDVTFDPLNEQQTFFGVFKSRWHNYDDVLELRINQANESYSSYRGVPSTFGNLSTIDESPVNRLAIQFHSKGASDGCLMCVNQGDISFNQGLPSINNKYIKKRNTQMEFIRVLKSLQAWERYSGKSDGISIQLQQIGNREDTPSQEETTSQEDQYSHPSSVDLNVD